ncbi:MAG: cellulase family glycosylhydrolase [Prolixibacteraceae bacterium]|jgi:endoglucanase|nr:cellulase family glycosylhydrolase [Prolixibacteraceae bacterium]
MRSASQFILTIFLIIAFNSCKEKGFLHTEGTKIVDAQNKEVRLRGMGLGGWMLQEGYMLETTRFAGSQHKIKTTIENLVGTNAMEDFYSNWLANYCTKTDIDSMAAWGFNSIRLPMHYNLFTLPIEDEPYPGMDTWHNKGFHMVDDLLEWCKKNEMYLILDLHAAPGGQGKDANISDYDTTKPSLWESPENQRKTIALWKKLAKRYANEPWMGAYDILNEPNWDFDNAGHKNGCNCTENELLWEFYGKAIKAIREVDKNHIVVIEGNCWGNNYKGAPNPNSYDNNLVVSFHKYWNFNKQEEIQYMVDMRQKYNVPIWMSESGENSNTWFTNAISLLENNNIGWAWWPYKKINSVTGTVTIPKTEGYQNLLNYWNGKNEAPEVSDAKNWLMQQAEMLKLENCIIHYDVIDAMFRQAQGDKTSKAFTQHTIPGIIHAVDYDLGANSFAFFDLDTANYRVSTGTNTTWNSGRKYRNDGVDIKECEADVTNGFCITSTQAGEWLNYSFSVENTGNYLIEINTKSEGIVKILIDDIVIGSSSTQSSINNWKTQKIKSIPIEKGAHQLKLLIEEEGIEINFIKITNT